MKTKSTSCNTLGGESTSCKTSTGWSKLLRSRRSIVGSGMQF
uniref:Uncharacterized protein n=1 Tax=Ciona intestinalis TaxID=7719 RepID=H2XKT4_CIOIN